MCSVSTNDWSNTSQDVQMEKESLYCVLLFTHLWCSQGMLTIYTVLPIHFRRCLDILSELSTFDQTLIYFDSEHEQLCPQVCRNWPEDVWRLHVIVSTVHTHQFSLRHSSSNCHHQQSHIAGPRQWYAVNMPSILNCQHRKQTEQGLIPLEDATVVL